MSDTFPKTLGKYEIKKELGKGAMGVVYLGFDPTLEREVALKVMASAIVSDRDLKERFEREAKSVARLQHPNIVTVYDLGYDDQGAPYIAMEYLRGNDLEHRIRRDPLTFREKLTVVSQTCRGLAHAHKHDIVHRDIKPANIFITDSGEAKIMDFGVARWQTSSHTQTGAVLGTADYMSPEQIKGARVDGRSDIFAVGVILFRLLTNKKPFAGENIQAVFFKVLNQDAPELLLPEGNRMPELQAIVDKALAKDADERYATADDLAEDLNDLLGLYHDSLNEDTVFETMFDPAMGVEESGSDGTGTGRRRATSSSGRILGATGSGSIARTQRPGTSYPPTMGARGQTSAGRTAVVGPTRMMSRTQVSATGIGAGAGVGIPIQESGGWWKFALGAVVLAGAAGAGYWATREPPPKPIVEAQGPTIEERLARARTALEGGLLTAAQSEVENILIEIPDHPEARALKEQIDQKQQESVRASQTTTTVRQEPVDPPRPGPSVTERGNKIAADASMAIGNGDFDRAEQLIREGRQIDPANNYWGDLAGQLQRARQNKAEAAAIADRQKIVDSYVSQALAHVQARDYEAAIAAYDEALVHDPQNVQLITGRNSAQVALEQQRAAAAVTAIVFKDSGTECIAADGGSNTPKGFQGGGVKVNRATHEAECPLELIVQIQPATVQPGDPFELRVRVYNGGNRPIGVKSLELVSQYGNKPATGRGQLLTPMLQQINARDTSVIFETRGNWSEEQNSGRIEATVLLIGNSQLRKTIEW